MAITRFTAEWSGMAGAPGYTNFFLDGAVLDPASGEAAAVSLMGFFEDLEQRLPGGVTITMQPQAVIIDEGTGNMTGIIPISAPPSVTGEGSGSYSGPVGAVVHWMTSTFQNGRLVRGRTFLVPLDSNSYDSAGTLDTGTHGLVQGAANTLLGALIDNPLTVWTRPKNGSAGTSNVVSSAVVPDLAAVLRSRRD